MLRIDLLQTGAWNLGWIVLAAAWLGPLPHWARLSFAAHMTLHMAVVAIAAPLLASAVAGRGWDPVKRAPALFSPLIAATGELLIVWTWHAPKLHHFARFDSVGFIIEQAMFLGAGLWVWLAALGGPSPRTARRSASGTVALFLTSMHMTLLGALLTLSPRVIFQHEIRSSGLTAIQDQHLGGAIMLVVGGLSFLSGSLLLMMSVLHERWHATHLPRSSCAWDELPATLPRQVPKRPVP